VKSYTATASTDFFYGSAPDAKEVSCVADARAALGNSGRFAPMEYTITWEDGSKDELFLDEDGEYYPRKRKANV
jgi:hypothetical protein